MRFYDPDSGTVQLDGHDLRDLRLVDVRHHVALLSQDALLLNTTVRDNISYGRVDADLQRVVEAAQGADADQFIRVDNLAEFTDADLVIACDGVNSRTRQLHRDHFGTRTRVGRNYYIWLDTTKLFTSLTFAFEQTTAGWIWFYGYPSAAEVSTCVLECSPETWRSLELGSDDSESGLRTLEKVFDQVLDGHPLISRDRGQPARWSQFVEIDNARWYHYNVVLMGDAAHAVHFSMGSGAELAITVATVLASCLAKQPELPTALETYDRKRRRRWRYLAHHATQIPAVRKGRHGYDSAPAVVLRLAPRGPLSAAPTGIATVSCNAHCG